MRAPSPAVVEAPSSVDVVRVSVLGCFRVQLGGEDIDLPSSAQRLIALLAVAGQPLRRSYLAGSLWPDKTDERATANLRSTLWRLNGPHLHLVQAAPLVLRLAGHVSVDLRETERQAQRLIDGVAPDRGWSHDLLGSLNSDLLPDWYDDWLIAERERLRQLRLHALEALARSHLERGNLASAIDAGLAAVCAEPLRESAHRIVIELHLAEGNWGEATRQYDRCRALLRTELGVEPSLRTQALMHPDSMGA